MLWSHMVCHVSKSDIAHTCLKEQLKKKKKKNRETDFASQSKLSQKKKETEGEEKAKAIAKLYALTRKRKNAFYFTERTRSCEIFKSLHFSLPSFFPLVIADLVLNLKEV